VVENAVRIMIWACSSTTAIRRFHMICRWIWVRALVSFDMGLRLLHCAALCHCGMDWWERRGAGRKYRRAMISA
jgi:hypothetical protein